MLKKSKKELNEILRSVEYKDAVQANREKLNEEHELAEKWHRAWFAFIQDYVSTVPDPERRQKSGSM